MRDETVCLYVLGALSISSSHWLWRRFKAGSRGEGYNYGKYLVLYILSLQGPGIGGQGILEIS